jgi:hypothetical protein
MMTMIRLIFFSLFRGAGDTGVDEPETLLSTLSTYFFGFFVQTHAMKSRLAAKAVQPL